MARVAWKGKDARYATNESPYPPEFRREAGQLVLAGRSVKDVAERLGCGEQRLHNWVKQHQLDCREHDDGLTSGPRSRPTFQLIPLFCRPLSHPLCDWIGQLVVQRTVWMIRPWSLWLRRK